MTKGKLIKLTLCGVVVGGLLILGWQRWQYSSTYVSTDNAELDGVIIPVRAKLSGVVISVPVVRWFLSGVALEAITAPVSSVFPSTVTLNPPSPA